MTTPYGPNSVSPLMGVDDQGHDVFRLHQYLIGLRRRHPWLHTARTSPLRLANRQYVYETRDGSNVAAGSAQRRRRDDAAVVARLGFDEGQIVAGSGAPPQSSSGRPRSSRTAG